MTRSARIVEVRLTIIEDDERGVMEAVAEAIRAAPASIVDTKKSANGSRPGDVDGTVTILFTDVEGSTALIEDLGDERALVLFHEHDSIVRETMARFEGADIRHNGDGFMGVFRSARRAVSCAIEVQRRMEAWNAARSTPPLRLRMGLNTGDAIAEGQDWFGEAVNFAARVAAKAGGGQIFASDLTRALVGDAGAVFTDLGHLKLKGMRGWHRVYDVGWRLEPVGSESRRSVIQPVRASGS